MKTKEEFPVPEKGIYRAATEEEKKRGVYWVGKRDDKLVLLNESYFEVVPHER